MYVVTFYSFKGGVGRTMALANVGAELARTGSRVLLVDFDLEAPGLHTFDLLKPAKPTKGIVDFVSEFLVTGSSPDVTGYLYEVDLKHDTSGALWVMPTGMPDEHYGERLANIDWQRLYAEDDGYVLFEDLKQQWKHAVSPDYVLIDSRTGHTDVGGICTRQLPDAAAILFFPNEQNRRGVEIVVDEIRADPSRSGQPVELYYVAANVPDLDDEDSILKNSLEQFKRSLGYERLDATVHHYSSLALLQQTIFTVERPRTKLAREYRRLTEKITSANLEDRRGVLAQLERFSARGGLARRTIPTDIETVIRQIRVLYGGDGEVLFSLARVNRQMGREEISDSLLAEARQAGFETVETLIDQARQLYRAGKLQDARRTVAAALTRPHQTRFHQSLPFELVLEFDPDFLEQLASHLDTNLALSDRLYIAERLTSSLEGAKAGERLLQPIADLPDTDPEADAVRFQLGLCLMPQKRFKEALLLFAPERERGRLAGIPELFNTAMAHWGTTGKAPMDLFARVVELHSDAKRPRLDENYCQCIALALWATGRREEALSYTAKAEAILGEMKAVFSAWRYLEVSSAEFRKDLSDLRQAVQTGEGIPAVFAPIGRVG
jgi:cellulose biosynthesis protein BcsQ